MLQFSNRDWCLGITTKSKPSRFSLFKSTTEKSLIVRIKGEQTRKKLGHPFEKEKKKKSSRHIKNSSSNYWLIKCPY